MQEKDVVSIEYFESPVRFADLVNGYVYRGEERVRPEDVREVSRTVAKVMKEPGTGDSIRTQVITADIVRAISIEMKVVVVAVESQTDIHYAMPIRVMNLESANYHKQWMKRKKQHREERDLAGAEFLSGYGKEDKLIPTITIVVYWGKEPWDGPTCLKDMMDMEAYSPELRGMIADYPIHLLEVRRLADLKVFHTDVQYVFGFLQHEHSKEKLASYIEEHEEVFHNLSEDAYDMISVMTHSRELREMREMHREGGENDMCQAIKDMIEDGRAEGRKEGRMEGQESTIFSLLKKALITVEIAAEELGMTVAEVEVRAEMQKEMQK